MRPSRHETAAPVPSLASPGRAGAHPPTRSLAPSLGARPEPRTPPRLCAGVLPLYNRHTRPYLPKALNPPPYGGSSKASTTLTLGEELGAYTVVATVADLEPVTFTATAKATPDFDEDGEVGFSDFFLFAEAFGGSDPRFDLDASGSVDFADFFLFAEHFGQPARAKLVALARELIGLPDGPGLQQNAPNPFNSQTVIPWFVLQPGSARLEVFAVTGQRVAVLHEGPQKAGLHRLRWDGRDEQGRPLASGVYLYRLVTAEAVQTRKLTLLR